jgi:hypothetical protein
MSLWLRILIAANGVIVVIESVVQGDRNFRVGLLLFWFILGTLSCYGLSLVSQRGRISINPETLDIRVKYSLRGDKIRRDAIRRLVVCRLRSVGRRRYPLLVIVGDADRCLAQIAFDRYTADDLARTISAIGIPAEGNWRYQPILSDMQTLFPGFRVWNRASVTAALWLALLVVVSVALTWILTPVVLR